MFPTIISDNVELQQIFAGVNLATQKSSHIFEENKRDFPTGNPLALIIKNQLEKIPSKAITQVMPHVVDMICKTKSNILCQWLIESPEFQKWQPPTDRIFFKHIDNLERKISILNYVYSSCAENYKKMKNKGFIIGAMKDETYHQSIILERIPVENKEMWTEILEHIHPQQKTKFFNTIAYNFRHTENISVIYGIYSLMELAVEQKIMSQKDANKTITLEIIGCQNKNESFRFPNDIIKKITLGQNLGFHLDADVLEGFQYSGKNFFQQLLERNPETALLLIKNQPNDIDLIPWMDTEFLKTSLKSYGNRKSPYDADKILTQIQDSSREAQIKKETKSLEKNINLTINKSPVNGDGNETISFKI